VQSGVLVFFEHVRNVVGDCIRLILVVVVAATIGWIGYTRRPEASGVPPHQSMNVLFLVDRPAALRSVDVDVAVSHSAAIDQEVTTTSTTVTSRVLRLPNGSTIPPPPAPPNGPTLPPRYVSLPTWASTITASVNADAGSRPLRVTIFVATSQADIDGTRGWADISKVAHSSASACAPRTTTTQTSTTTEATTTTTRRSETPSSPPPPPPPPPPPAPPPPASPAALCYPLPNELTSAAFVYEASLVIAKSTAARKVTNSALPPPPPAPPPILPSVEISLNGRLAVTRRGTYVAFETPHVNLSTTSDVLDQPRRTDRKLTRTTGPLYQPRLDRVSYELSAADAHPDSLEPIVELPLASYDGPGLQWTDTSSGRFLGDDVDSQNRDEARTFQSGLLLGIAGAGLIATIPESFEAVKRRRERLGRTRGSST